MVELKSYDEQDRVRQLINVKKRKIKFRLIESFNQDYNIVVYIRESAGRTEEFRALTKKIIPLNNRTR